MTETSHGTAFRCISCWHFTAKKLKSEPVSVFFFFFFWSLPVNGFGLRSGVVRVLGVRRVGGGVGEGEKGALWYRFVQFLEWYHTQFS